MGKDPRVVVTPQANVEPQLRKLARALIQLARQQITNEQVVAPDTEPPQETAA